MREEASAVTNTESYERDSLDTDVTSHPAINLWLLHPALGSSFIQFFLDDGKEVLTLSIIENK